jgi:capsular polysaccharide biosynthesis protein
VVNRWIFDSRFFAYLRQRSTAFAGLNWRVQEPGEWLRVGRAYRIHAAPFVRSSFAKVRALYRRVGEAGGRRVFLSRDPKMFGRGIHNEREVAALLGRHGFETIYAEHLTLEDQQRTFEETTHLVALQGMGLVQQLFMDADQGHVLELMPANRLQSEYYWQGWTLGMRFYDVQTGSDTDTSGMYRVDLARLDAGVRRMLDHPADHRRYGETLIPDAQPAC